jgi:hypothetical protein
MFFKHFQKGKQRPDHKGTRHDRYLFLHFTEGSYHDKKLYISGAHRTDFEKGI